VNRLLLLTVGLSLLAVACGSSVNAIGIMASTPGSIGVGEQRILMAVEDTQTRESLALPDSEVTATLRDRIGTPLGEYQGEFVWMIPEVRGLYKFEMDIPGPGTFQVTLEGEEIGEPAPVGLVAVEDPTVIQAGEDAPQSVTRTTRTNDLSDITTDPSPDPAFYEMTVAEAVESGASVLVFATPAWCVSQTCGPMLNQVKALSEDYPDLNYVHVEIYENIHADSFQDLVAVPAVSEWGLPSEPWVFVTDGSGVVTAAFQGVASDDELSAAFAEVSS
jgi:hypothetical protein